MMLPSSFAAQIADFFGFEPTPSQQIVIDTLADFVCEEVTTRYDDHSIYVLRGYAGTGKSSLIGALAQALVAHQQPLVLLAPTGRAAKVLQGYCGMSAYTIHHTIYRERRPEGTEGGGAFELGYNKARQNTLFIVDEASMISNVSDGLSPFGTGCLLDDLLEYCFSREGSKILFIGDDAQLPPVGTTLSPAMDAAYLQRYSPRVYTGALTDIVRQAEASEIVTLSHLLRARIIDMSGGISTWDIPLLPRPTGAEVTIISGNDLPEYVESSYRRVGKEETVLLTRSNKDAEGFNQQIRYRTLDYDEEVVGGEMLMVCRNNYLHVPTDERGFATAAFVANGELLRVLSTHNAQRMYGFDFREASLVDAQGGEIYCKILLDSLYSGTASLTSEQRQLLFSEVSQDYAHLTTKRDLYRALRQDPYLNALQIKYAYAMTCHKAQGGQWRHVYLHFGYLTAEMIDESFCRWLYTAMTRATERLYIINPPDFIFGAIDLDW